MTKQEVLEEIHVATAKLLLSRIKSGEATAADVSNAIKFLKDNGIEATSPKNHKPLQNLAELVPFADTGT